MKDCDKHILLVLGEAGHEGLPLRKIVKHVYNAVNSLFEPVDFSDVRRFVHNFIRRNCKGPGSVIKNAGKRGYYRLNVRSEKARALMSRLEEKGTADVDVVSGGTGSSVVEPSLF